MRLQFQGVQQKQLVPGQMQKKAPDRPLICPICGQKYNYKNRLPLLFKSGCTYCADCTEKKLHLVIEEDPYHQGEDKENTGWKNLDLLQYLESELGEAIESEIIEQYRILQGQRVQVLKELEDTKVIIQWEIQKTKDQIQELKTAIKKQEKAVKTGRQEQINVGKQTRQKLNNLIKNERHKGNSVDEEIKELEAEFKCLTLKGKKQNKLKVDPTHLQTLYKEVKKEGLKSNLQRIGFPLIFVPPRELQNSSFQMEEAPVQEQKRVTKFFM